MSNDLQMARGAAEGEINLAIGEPVFLQKILLQYVRAPVYRTPMQYPAVGGEPRLLEWLQKLFPQYKYFVVANGAKQAIEAAFFAFNKLERKTTVSHKAPYWPSYPTLAKNRGLGFNFTAPASATITCITSPNNPDGSQEIQADCCDLWDAAYAHPIYGYNGIPPRHRVAIYSASKYLGLSGMRVGWLATNEKALADQAAYFVETTTSGVAIHSQAHVASVFEGLQDPNVMQFLTQRSLEARYALLSNGHLFNELFGRFTQYIRGVPLDGSGMFAWFKVKDPQWGIKTFQKAKIKVVTGDACGIYEPGWYRMSCGQMPDVTKEALTRLKSVTR